MNTASTARVRAAAVVHHDRVMQPLDDLATTARALLQRVQADFPTLFDARRNRRASDRTSGAAA